MHSRESIPNVGRRAQGRKSLFVMKGSGVNGLGIANITPAPFSTHEREQGQGRRSSWQPNESVAWLDEEEDEAPWSSTGDCLGSLSQPGHPYNRIIQRILQRHQVVQSHPLRHDPNANSSRPLQQLPNHPDASNSTNTTLDRHRQMLSDDKNPETRRHRHLSSEEKSHEHRPRKDRKKDKASRRSSSEPGGSRSTSWKSWSERKAEDKSPRQRNGVERRRKHRDGDRDRGANVASSRTVESEEREIASSPAGFATGGSSGSLSDRSYLYGMSHRIYKHPASDVSEYDKENDSHYQLDTTRSEPADVHKLTIEEEDVVAGLRVDHTSQFPSTLSSSLSKETVDDLLDYFWIYQGMGRQVLDMSGLHHGSGPGREGGKRVFTNKPTKLPPIPISTGQKAAALVSQQHDTISISPGDKNAYSPIDLSREYRASRLPAGAASEAVIRNPPGHTRNRVHESRRAAFTVNSQDRDTENDEKRGYATGSIKKLVVQMPVLVQESTSADLIEND